MTKTKIFSLAMWPVILGLAFLVYRSVASEIELAEEIKKSEARVIEKLKIIREAQRAYLQNYGDYAADWDTLVNFVKSDSIYITEKREIIIPREREDPRYYLGDSIRVEVDTIGVEPVMAYVFPEDKYPRFNPERLPYVPGYPIAENKRFELFADEIEKSGVKIDVVEVIDPYPMDRTRSDTNANPKRWLLRFGSRNEVTTSGNWE